MASTSRLIETTVTRQSRAPGLQAFGQPLAVSVLPAAMVTAYGSARTRDYFNIDEVEDDGAVAADEIHKLASAFFDQPNRPRKLKIGRRLTPVAEVIKLVITAVNDFSYTVAITTEDGVSATATYLSDSSATIAEVRDNLITQINALANAAFFTATASTDDILITSDIAGVPLAACTVSANLVKTTQTASVGISNDLAAIKDETNDWYWLLSQERSDWVAKRAAAWAEANKKLFVFSTDTTEPLDSSDSSNIATILTGLSYDRTALAYHATDADYIDAAQVGEGAKFTPGSRTFIARTYTGVDADTITDAQSDTAAERFVNTYELAPDGAPFSYGGFVVSGTFIDIIWGTDALVADLTNAWVAALRNNDKITYDRAGKEAIASVLRGVLGRFAKRPYNFVQPDYTVYIPEDDEISDADRTGRHMPGIVAELVYQGAVHSVDVRLNFSF